eukprot:403336457
MKLEVEPVEAVILGFGFSSLFVLSLYFWKFFEGKKPASQVYDENSTQELLKRITSVVVFSFACMSFINIRADHRQRQDVELVRWFGLQFNGNIAFAIANTAMLNSILFLGEIVQYFVGMKENQYDEISLLGFKNIVLAPMFEEFIFRGCLINIFVEANIMSLNKCVLILPAFFAIAHLHHLFQQRHLPKDQFRRVLMGKLFQLCFTQVFGIYAGYVYVYTGSLWAAIALHAQCNYFGFPSFGNLFDENYSSTKRQIVGYLYLVGIILFYNTLGVFLNPDYYDSWLLSHYQLNNQKPQLHKKQGQFDISVNSSPPSSNSNSPQSPSIASQTSQNEEQDHQIGSTSKTIKSQRSQNKPQEKPFMLTFIGFLSLLTAQLCWYSPLAASKQISNAYGLNYIELNISVYYINLAIQAAFAILIACFIEKKYICEDKSILGSLIFCGIGSLLRIISVAGGEYGTFWLLALGQAFIGLSIVSILLIQLQRLHQPSSSQTNIMNIFNVNLIVLSQFGGIFLSQFLYQAIFVKSDSFFYKSASAHRKNVIYNVIQTGLVIVTAILYLLINRKYQKNQSVEIADNHGQDQNQIYKLSVTQKLKITLSNGVNYLMMMSFGFINAAFFLQLMKWRHIANQFNFTQVRTIFIGAIAGTFSKADVGLTTFLAFMIGFFISTWYNQFLNQAVTLIDKTNQASHSILTHAMILTMGGAMASAITAVGDKIHYMNRDIRTFIYISEAIVGGLIFLAYAILMFLSRHK